MLYSLSIENVALIDKLNVEFDMGLNVLTGESGAGKSIIINSINLLLGDRADKDMIKSGCSNAYIEAIFYLDHMICKNILAPYKIKCEEELIVSRSLSLSGKNICKINGKSVNLNTLKYIMSQIVDLHGQHTYKTLLEPGNHINILDTFADISIVDLKNEISTLYSQLINLRKKQKNLGGNDADRIQLIELLNFQIKELDQASIIVGEIDNLHCEYNALLHAEEIISALRESYEIIYGSDTFNTVILQLNNCIELLSNITQYEKLYENYCERINENIYSLDDIAHEIHDQINIIKVDNTRREEIEERLAFIKSLFRKYNVNNEKELLDFLNYIKSKLKSINESESLLADIDYEIEDIENKLIEKYNQLTNLRLHAAKFLKKAMETELSELGMADAKFETQFFNYNNKSIKFSNNGIDKIEFYLSTNSGEPIKPLSKVASGGELSRIMLAFKKIYAKNDSISTFIFDEIDTGISGKMAIAVAKKLAFISLEKQVICVSHLPQIAAIADHNYLISKEDEDSIKIKISRIDKGSLIEEIARLSGGIHSANALKHAYELKEKAEKYKRNLITSNN